MKSQALSREVEPPAGYTRLTGRKGSHSGGICTDGERAYYWKVPPTVDHAHIEVLAAKLYRIAGVKVPSMVCATSADGTVGILSPMVVGQERPYRERLADERYMCQLRRGFAVDVWLANWDVVGSDGALGNIVTGVDGAPCRIDMGGALTFRALGQSKGTAFDCAAHEWWTMRDRSVNRAAAAVFGPMGPSALADSARTVWKVDPKDVRKAIERSALNVALQSELLGKLLARREAIPRLAVSGC